VAEATVPDRPVGVDGCSESPLSVAALKATTTPVIDGTHNPAISVTTAVTKPTRDKCMSDPEGFEESKPPTEDEFTAARMFHQA
jgi:hypothetical protein